MKCRMRLSDSPGRRVDRLRSSTRNPLPNHKKTLSEVKQPEDIEIKNERKKKANVKKSITIISELFSSSSYHSSIHLSFVYFLEEKRGRNFHDMRLGPEK